MGLWGLGYELWGTKSGYPERSEGSPAEQISQASFSLVHSLIAQSPQLIAQISNLTQHLSIVVIRRNQGPDIGFGIYSHM